jgi:hypothetical protein
MRSQMCALDFHCLSKWRFDDWNDNAFRYGQSSSWLQLVAQACVMFFSLGVTTFAEASDHLDSPATVANPQADISDVYAWVSPEGKQLNLAMTVLGHSFSNKVRYTLHVDSGNVFGHTNASTAIECIFPAANSATCTVGTADSASGDVSGAAGIEGKNRRFRVFAGLRDDPFYNNIKGLLGAYQTAIDATKNGAVIDAAGCAQYDEATVRGIQDQMTHTEKGPAQNFLGNWTVAAIVISVDLDVVTQGGKVLAVWGTTSSGSGQMDRMARPFVTNTLLGSAPFSPDDASGVLRQKYNEVRSATAASFVPDLQKGLAFQDSLDGKCGNQILSEATVSSSRYSALAKVFDDDRLWVDTTSSVCTQFFAVELAALKGKKTKHDCGGRSPTYDTSNVWRSLLIAGATAGVSDGLRKDEHPPSATVFPFLAPPDAHSIDH